MPPITDVQLAFIEKYIKLPKAFGRKDAKKKREEWAGEFRRFNTLREEVKGRIALLPDADLRSRLLGQVSGAEEIILSDTKTPNFDGGMKRLIEIAKIVDGHQVFVDVERELAIVGPQAQRLIETGSSNAAELTLILGFAQEKAQSGKASGNLKDTKSAMGAIERLKTEIGRAATAAPLVPDGTVGQAQNELKIDAHRHTALSALDAQGKRWSALSVRLLGVYADTPPPPALESERQAIGKLIETDRSGEPDAIGRAATQASDRLDGLEPLVETSCKARIAYEDRRGALVRGPHAVLTAHRMKDHAVVAPLIQAVETSLQDAAASALNHDLPAATNHLQAAETGTATGQEAADELAEYLDVKADRAERMKAVTAISPTLRAHRTVAAACKAAEDDWAAITTAFDAPAPDLGQMKAVAPKLASLPALAAAAADIARQAEAYDTQYAKRFNEIGVRQRNKARAGIVGAPGTLIDEMIGRLRTEIEAANINRTGDYRVSMGMLQKTRALTLSIDAKTKEVEAMNVAKAAFDLRHNEVTTKLGTPGGIALVDYGTRLDNDALHAADRAGKGEFAMATATYVSSAAGHAEQIGLHVLATTYVNDRAAKELRLNAVRTGPGSAEAADLAAAVQGALDAAHAARLAKKWQNAVDLLAVVEKRLVSAERARNNAGILAARDNPGVVAAVGTDRDAAFAVFDQCYDAVKTLGLESGEFADLATQARDFRQQADAAMQGSAPNAGAAAQALTQGIAICKRLVKLEVERAAYTQLRGEVQSLYDQIENGSLNDSGYFDTELETIERLWTEAADAIDPPAFDYPGAMARMRQAREEAQRVVDDAAAVTEAKRTRQDLQNLRDQIDNHKDLKPNMAPELARLGEILNAIDSDLATRKPADALKKARDGAQESKLFITIGKDCRGYLESLRTVLEPAEKQLGELATLFPMATGLAANAQSDVNDLRSQMAGAVTARSFRTANWLVYRVKTAVESAYTAARSGAAYEERLGPAEKLLLDMEKRCVPENVPLTEGLKVQRARLDKAKALAGLDQFKSAYDTLAGMAEAIASLEPLAVLHERYAAALKGADEALDAAAKLPNETAVQPMLARARSNRTLGADLGTKGDYAAAAQVLEEAASLAREAIRAAADFAEYTTLAEGVTGAAEEDEDPTEALETALRRAGMVLSDLRTGDGALAIIGHVMAADGLLGEARELLATDAKQAAAKIAEAMTRCVAGRRDAGLYAQLVASETAAVDALESLLGTHPQAGFIRDDGEAELLRIETAMNAVRGDPAKMSQAEVAIATAMARSHALRTIADRQAEVEALLAKLEPGVEKLDSHTHRYAVAKEIGDMRTAMSTARGLAKAHDHKGALDLLRDTAARLTNASLMADMQAGSAPDQESLKEILSRAKGHEDLDKLVARLDDSARKRVMVDIFKARFGCELVLYKTKGTDAFVTREMERFRTANPSATSDEIDAERQRLKILDRSQNLDMDMDEAAPDVKRFYDVMTKLPPTDTRDNDSMKIFTSRGESQGSFYSGRRREVVMVEANGGDAYYTVGAALELDSVDANCKPEKGEMLSFFSWNTLHEVGHAVDDKLGYMKRNGKARGGWEDYGANVVPVATAVSGHFKLNNVAFAAAYLKRKLAKKNDGSRDEGESEKPGVPPAPPGVDPDEWDRRIADACAYMDRIRTDRNPWQTATSAKDSALGDTCYQESYNGSWTSYPLAERKQGVTGYQFRAPGEWFSELYAAFHSGKMNKSHPARTWLATLDNP